MLSILGIFKMGPYKDFAVLMLIIAGLLLALYMPLFQLSSVLT